MYITEKKILFKNSKHTKQEFTSTIMPETIEPTAEDRHYEERAHSVDFHGPQTENSHDLLRRFSLILRSIGSEFYNDEMYDCIEQFPSNWGS